MDYMLTIYSISIHNTCSIVAFGDAPTVHKQ